mmetsp:Transcript_67501/g.140682  ORF Transcript_67501/g.140682 Transcript_67501/m.140682 type:complete len:340 (+) Transcript_67501:138-1157(+)|eukprot:CAMPEP_0181332374 /NCGR_PEP_ID=MMETSP1101-20121128/25059_1 /TAXON_ID=46948 /ORGANISM="Rhodomonas abbreviata, Strain Caron Lab Isolate" /LENGTH=339 /DNA_ID=CAMNT_0023442013 /DNA_START=136 /DNA_END=1155 /DNA_ORIENTATION=+
MSQSTLPLLFAGVVLCCSLVAGDHVEEHPACLTFKEIYGDAKTMAEQMWDGAFTYETNEEIAFTMRFIGPNPNHDVMLRRNATGVETYRYDTERCHLDYWHKDAPVEDDTPGREPESFTQCLSWKDRACCHADTVSTDEKIRALYGDKFHWDRCGKMSTACQAFFVDEACFYECEPTAGLYRKWHHHEYDPTKDEGENENCATDHPDDPDACNHNTWQMEKMPVSANYWNAWFDACKNERFCAAGSGSYFSCALEWEEFDNREVVEVEVEKIVEKKELSTGAIIGIAIACVFGLGACGFAVHMIRKERAGEPVFQPLNRAEARQDAAAGGNQETSYAAP